MKKRDKKIKATLLVYLIIFLMSLNSYAYRIGDMDIGMTLVENLATAP